VQGVMRNDLNFTRRLHGLKELEFWLRHCRRRDEKQKRGENVTSHDCLKKCGSIRRTKPSAIPAAKIPGNCGDSVAMSGKHFEVGLFSRKVGLLSRKVVRSKVVKSKTFTVEVFDFTTFDLTTLRLFR
jgi:hypothetical protein